MRVTTKYARLLVFYLMGLYSLLGKVRAHGFPPHIGLAYPISGAHHHIHVNAYLFLNGRTRQMIKQLIVCNVGLFADEMLVVLGAFNLRLFEESINIFGWGICMMSLTCCLVEMNVSPLWFVKNQRETSLKTNLDNSIWVLNLHTVDTKTYFSDPYGMDDEPSMMMMMKHIFPPTNRMFIQFPNINHHSRPEPTIYWLSWKTIIQLCPV